MKEGSFPISDFPYKIIKPTSIFECNNYLSTTSILDENILLKTKLDQLKDENQTQKILINQIEDERSEFEDQVEQLQKELSKKFKPPPAQSDPQQLASLLQQLSNQRKLIQILEKTKDEQKFQLQKYRMNGDPITLATQNRNLKAEVARLTQALLQDNKQFLLECENDKQNQFLLEIQKLQHDIERKNHLLSEKKEQLNHLEVMNEVLRSSHKLLQQEKSKVDSELLNLQDKFTEYEANINLLNETITDLRAENQVLINQIQQKNETNDFLEHQVSSLQLQVQKNKVYSQRLPQITDKEDYEESNENIEEEDQQTKEELLEILEDKIQEISEKNHQIQKLKKMIHENQLQIDGYELTYKQASTHIRELEEENMKLKLFKKEHSEYDNSELSEVRQGRSNDSILEKENTILQERIKEQSAKLAEIATLRQVDSEVYHKRIADLEEKVQKLQKEKEKLAHVNQ